MPKTKRTKKPLPQKKPFSWDLSGVPTYLCWNRLRSLRESSGLTQITLSVNSGVSATTILQCEAGNDVNTTDSVKKRLADFFGCKIQDVFPTDMVGKIPEREFLKRVIEKEKAAAARE